MTPVDQHKKDMDLLRFAAMFLASLVANELLIRYFESRYICVAWALACLWVLTDGMLVATQLAVTEKAMQDMTRRCEALEIENLLPSNTILKNSENHLLLCEIRQRIILHGQRHRAHSHGRTEVELASKSTPVRCCIRNLVADPDSAPPSPFARTRSDSILVSS